jgi:hypothetical protein
LQGSPPTSGSVITNTPSLSPLSKSTTNRHGLCSSTQPGKHPINNKKELFDEEFWTIFNLTEQNPDNQEYQKDSEQIGEESAQAIAGWDTKERAKSSTKPTRSFDINSEHAAIATMANFVILIQFMATDEKYQPDDDKKLVLVEWVKDTVYLICKKADRSWKKELDQNSQWFWL